MSDCVDIRKEDSNSEDNKWSLASLNPLSWLFPDKSEAKNNENKGPIRRKHLPISRRAGLSDIKAKKTYNDLQPERNLNKRRKLHPKQPVSLWRGAYKRTESSSRLLERRRRRRRRRKQGIVRNQPKRTNSHYQAQDRGSEYEDFEEYLYEEDSVPSDSIESRQYDLLTSDHEPR